MKRRLRVGTSTLAILAALSVVQSRQASAGTIFPDDVLGTWHINANKTRASVLIAEWRAHQDGVPQPIGYWMNENGTTEPLAQITYDWRTNRLRFQRANASQWFLAEAKEGVLVGRFATTSIASPPADYSSVYQHHVTGWNDQVFSSSIVPRVWDVRINGEYKAKIRIDRADSGTGVPTSFVGRFKIYATNSGAHRGEDLEYDINVTGYDGNNLWFSRQLPNGTVQHFIGSASGRAISGTFHNGTNWLGSWSGERAELLTYGLSSKSPAQRSEWERKTRAILQNLTMDGNPTPSAVRILLDRTAILEGPDDGPLTTRDDEPTRYARNRNVREITFEFDIPSRYSATPLRRRAHGFLAVPTSPRPAAGYPILLAVNGHHGSGWNMMSPMDRYPGAPAGADANFFYADTFARRGFVVFALDISHHAYEDTRGLYGATDGGSDEAHGMPFSPAIRASGFDSDWEEDGEKTWDGSQVLSWLLRRSDVNPNRVLVTGLSMGGEVAMYLGALDPRITGTVTSGYSPDMDVMENFMNHGCYKWASANIREYVNASDFYALIAPRKVIVQTGVLDRTFSNSPIVPPYSADKQVIRRAKTAHADSGSTALVHVLHDSHHRWRFGLRGPFAQTGMRAATLQAPRWTGDLAWQTDSTTQLRASDLLTLLQQIGW